VVRWLEAEPALYRVVASPEALEGAPALVLWSEKSHLSARDIFEKLNDLGRNIGHTSVYQNLEALQSAGVIECLDRASGRLYGYRADPHSHLTCIESGQIQDLDVYLPEELLRRIEEHTGFTIESYTLHLAGRPRH
jgi:Fur family ferric uptake transcriptional regulator